MTDLFGPGLKAQLLETTNLPVPDEAKLLQAVCDKVGTSANKEKLLWHLRASRGKVHWAVNSYLRAVLTTSPRPAREDFDPRPAQPAVKHTQQQQQPQVAAAAAGASLTAGNRQQQTPQVVASPASGCTQQDGESQTSPSRSSPAQSPNSTKGSVSADDATAAAAAASAPVRLDSLPSSVLEQVLSCLDLASLLNAACSCQALHRAAQAEGLWRGLFHARWGTLLFPVNTYGSSSCSGGGRSGARSSNAAALDTSAVGSADAPSGGGHAQRSACAPVPLFDAARHMQYPAPAAAAVATQHPSVTNKQQQQQQQGAAGSSPQQGHQPPHPPPSDVVSRWTGSSCVSPRSSGEHPTHMQRGAASSPSTIAARPPSPAGVAVAGSSACQSLPLQSAQLPQQQQRSQEQQQDSGHPAADLLPAAAPSGSWQRQFKQQYAYQATRLCPKCGTSSIVPIVYGFPSPGLLAGMHVKRLVLGGDHLIESCHVWACAGCRSCFRFYPYVNVQLWLQDDAAQQRQDHARAAAAAGGRESVQGAARAAVGAAAAVQQQPGQQQGDHAGGVAGSDAGCEGFPRYTYEL